MDKTIKVAIIDDDADVLDALQLYLERNRLSVVTFSSATKFVEALECTRDFDCIVCDVRMRGMTGLDLQRTLTKGRSKIPLILISGHGDIEMAVSAIKAGAFDFLEKPLDERRLLTDIEKAVQSRQTEIDADSQKTRLLERFKQLSDRQRDVVRNAVQGLSNKEIAARLGISPRTVEHYREQAMQRMQADNLAELVQMAMYLELFDSMKSV